MGQLDQARRATRLGQLCPLLPLAEMWFLQRFIVTDNIALDGQKADVDLHLAGDDAAVIGVRPLCVEVLPLVEGWVVERPHREGFLHGAFHKAVREGETAGEGDGLCYEFRGCYGVGGAHDGGRGGRWFVSDVVGVA